MWMRGKWEGSGCRDVEQSRRGEEQRAKRTKKREWGWEERVGGGGEGVDGRQKEGSGSREAGGAGGDLGGVAQCRHNNISTKAAIFVFKRKQHVSQRSEQYTVMSWQDLRRHDVLKKTED